ncbi:MAG: hypothetical protein RLP44_18680 [Aggregatilineales bacterium]
MKRVLMLCLLTVFALVACSSDSNSASTDDTESTIPVTVETENENPTAVVADDPTPTVESVSASAVQSPTTEQVQQEPAPQTVAYNGPEWTQIPLTNAVTGETFTLADFAGKAIFVHPMATWCTNCLASQTNIRNNVIDNLDPSQFAFISLSVETNISSATLAEYAARNSFGWTFAVLTPDSLAALVRAFGPSISNPPVQPHFIISPDGTPTDLMTGSDSAQTIIDDLNAASGA